MEGGVFAGVIAGVVLAVLGGILYLARTGQPREEAGRLVFRYGLPLRILAALLLFGPLIGITVLVMFKPPVKEGDLYAILGLYALFGGLGLPLFWEMWVFSLVVDDDGLTCHSPWRGQFYIAWGEVRELVWAAMGSYFIIKGKDRWFRVSQMTSGLSRMLEEFEKHLPPEKLRAARQGYGVAGRAFPGDVSVQGPVGQFDLRKWSEDRRRERDKPPPDGRDDIQPPKPRREEY